MQEKALHQSCSGLEGQPGLLSCIFRSFPLILTGVLFLLTQTEQAWETRLCGRGGHPVWLQLGCQSSSIQECKYGLKSAACAPQHSAWGSQMVHPEAGTRRGRQEIKVSPVSFQEGLYCIVWFHEEIAPSWSTKVEGKSHFLHRYPLNVYLYFYICAYINMCMYTYVAWYEGTEAMWNTLSFRSSRRIPHWLPQKRGEDYKGSSFLCPGFCFYSCVQFVLEWKLVSWSSTAATFYRALALSVCRGDVFIW